MKPKKRRQRWRERALRERSVRRIDGLTVGLQRAVIANRITLHEARFAYDEFNRTGEWPAAAADVFAEMKRSLQPWREEMLEKLEGIPKDGI